jgi:acyl-CoA synthetase (AMP-forming)/AMP-acid ligase II
MPWIVTDRRADVTIARQTQSSKETGMYHPYHHARSHPDKVAYVMAASGESVSYRELDQRSNQGAHLLRRLGLKRGDSVALMLDNNARYLEICFAAQRSGLFFTAMSSRLTAQEAEYILGDCGAKAFIVSASVTQSAANCLAIGAGNPASPRCPWGPLPTRVPDATCSIRPAPPAGPRA